MSSPPEPSALPGPPPKAPTRRLGILRFQHQVGAIDELIYDFDPNGTGSAPGDDDDAYEGLAVEVMRVLRDAEGIGSDPGDAIRSVIPRAEHELVTRIVAAWDAN